MVDWTIVVCCVVLAVLVAVGAWWWATWLASWVTAPLYSAWGAVRSLAGAQPTGGSVSTGTTSSASPTGSWSGRLAVIVVAALMLAWAVGTVVGERRMGGGR